MLEAAIHTADHGALGHHAEGTGILCPRVKLALFSFFAFLLGFCGLPALSGSSLKVTIMP